MKSVPFAPPEPAIYRETVRRALAEDLGWGDVTTEGTVRAEQRAKGTILAKSACVIAGLDVAAEAFRQLDPSVSFVPRVKDGDRCEPGARRRRRARCRGRDAHRRTDGVEFPAAVERYRNRDAHLRRRGSGTHHDPRYAERPHQPCEPWRSMPFAQAAEAIIAAGWTTGS